MTSPHDSTSANEPFSAEALETITITEGSGNVFADLGLPDAEARLAAAERRRQSRLRIGFLGGTFNPPHHGHLLAALDAAAALDLDRLIFVPAATQPLKTHLASVDAVHRVAMLRRLIHGHPMLSVSTIETRRGGVSYTVDTLSAFARRYRYATRFWLLGADVCATFAQWREPERVALLAQLVVMQRAGDAPDVAAMPASTRVISTRRFDLSSTEIRERVQRGASLHGFVPPAVARYIRRHRLYQHDAFADQAPHTR